MVSMVDIVNIVMIPGLRDCAREASKAVGCS